MDTKYFTEEITTMKDGTIASAITEKASKDEAISNCLSACAYALLNKDVAHIHAEAKDNLGNIFEYKDYDVTI